MVIFLPALVVLVILQTAAKKFHPFLYWATTVASTTFGTTMADFADRSLGIGYQPCRKRHEEWHQWQKWFVFSMTIRSMAIRPSTRQIAKVVKVDIRNRRRGTKEDRSNEETH